MIKPIKKLIRENYEKCEQLLGENKEYYENFLVYVRSAPLKDERAKEEVLLEMLDHLLLAQNEGKTAETVFGKNPKELADDIIDNLPREPFKYVFTFALEMILTVFAYYTIVMGIVDIVAKKATVVYSGNAIIIGVLLIAALALLIYVVFSQIKKDSFAKKKSKGAIIMIGIVFFVTSVGVALLTTKMPKIGTEIDLGRYGVFSIACLLMLVTFIMKKIREQR